MRRFWTADIEGVGLPSCYSSCIHNEMHILRTKVLACIDKEPFKPPGRTWKVITKIWKRRMRKLCGDLTPLTNEEFIASYDPGAKRNDYSMAVKYLEERGYSRKDFRIRSFIKQEKKVFKGVAKERLIQARGLVANVVLGRRLKVIERCAYGLKSSRRWGVNPTRLLAKGMSQSQRAAVLIDKWSNFNDPVCISVDAVAFDRHVREYQLDSLDRMYESLFPGDSEFKTALRYRLGNTSFTTRHGIKYIPEPQRMSGDMDTSIGNCLLVAMMIEHVMMSLRIRKFDMFNDGDDTLILVERIDLEKLKTNLDLEFEKLGHNIRVEGIFHELSGIEHCHHHLMMSLSPPRFVRDIKRSLSGVASSVNKFISKRAVRRYLKLMSACEMCLGRGVPMVQPVAQMLYNGCGKITMVRDVTLAIHRMAKLERLDQLCVVEPITMAARLEVEAIYGYSVADQLDFESQLEFPHSYEFTKEPLCVIPHGDQLLDWRD